MQTVFRKAVRMISASDILIILTMITFTACGNPYAEGGSEDIVITMGQLDGSIYRVTIRNEG